MPLLFKDKCLDACKVEIKDVCAHNFAKRCLVLLLIDSEDVLKDGRFNKVTLRKKYDYISQVPAPPFLLCVRSAPPFTVTCDCARQQWQMFGQRAPLQFRGEHLSAGKKATERSRFIVSLNVDGGKHKTSNHLLVNEQAGMQLFSRFKSTLLCLKPPYGRGVCVCVCVRLRHLEPALLSGHTLLNCPTADINVGAKGEFQHTWPTFLFIWVTEFCFKRRSMFNKPLGFKVRCAQRSHS